MKDARAHVLERIRAAAAPAPPHPGPHPGERGPARVETFATAVAAAGGEVHGPLARAELGRAVAARMEGWAPRGRLVAEPTAAGLLGAGVFETAGAGSSPHEFGDVAVAVVRGALGVAEDGAVAVLGRDAPNRSLLFLAEHLVLLLEAGSIVPDLHAALRALPSDALRSHHVTWISGPSKTADIEQTLVRGAHGPRALAVFAYRGG